MKLFRDEKEEDGQLYVGACVALVLASPFWYGLYLAVMRLAR